MRNEASSERLTVERRSVEGTCPECGHEDLATYHANSEGGWLVVVKCQRCLYSVSREPWNLHGPITMLVETIKGTGK